MTGHTRLLGVHTRLAGISLLVGTLITVAGFLPIAMSKATASEYVISLFQVIAISLILGTPFFVVFGTLSDKIGRKPIIMAGLLLAILTYFPLFKALTNAANPDLARAQATQADAEIKAGKYRGPLHGLPYGVKDLFATKGIPTTWGAADFATRIIDEDAEVVVRLREAGAVLVAKLSTGLFAQNDQWFRGRTNNPWNLSQGSSGSSAGPASATAAGCVAFSIGTETSGSIVSPSTRCGVSALRPTFGRVSRSGGMVLAWSQDRVGPITRSVEDAAMVFNVIHGADEKDPSTLTTPFHFERNIKFAGLRIGVDPNGAPKEFVDKLRDLALRVVAVRIRRLPPRRQKNASRNRRRHAVVSCFAPEADRPVKAVRPQTGA